MPPFNPTRLKGGAFVNSGEDNNPEDGGGGHLFPGE